MSEVSVVIVNGDTGLGAGIGEALGVRFLSVRGDEIGAKSESLLAADRLVWIHPVPACTGTNGSLSTDGVFVEAATLLASAQAARTVAQRCKARLVFIAVFPARGLVTGEHGAACDMAFGAMESMMRVQIGPWSNEAYRLVGIVYSGLKGYSEPYMRSADEIRKRTPMHELCTLGQLADAIRFVGSDRAAYITGTALRVDGGWNAYSWFYPARTI